MWSATVEFLQNAAPHLSMMTDVMRFGITATAVGRTITRLVRRSRAAGHRCPRCRPETPER